MSRSVNKVLLEHDHAHLFPFYLWLLCAIPAKLRSCRETIWLIKPKDLLPGPSQKNLTHSALKLSCFVFILFEIKFMRENLSGGRGRGRGRSRIPAEQDSGLHPRTLGSWAESNMQTLDWLSHPGIPEFSYSKYGQWTSNTSFAWRLLGTQNPGLCPRPTDPDLKIFRPQFLLTLKSEEYWFRGLCLGLIVWLYPHKSADGE